MCSGLLCPMRLARWALLTDTRRGRGLPTLRDEEEDSLEAGTVMDRELGRGGGGG